ncbi:MAG: hypothetical protein QW035_01020 [Candidatus Anstonellales archaeon]
MCGYIVLKQRKFSGREGGGSIGKEDILQPEKSQAHYSEFLMKILSHLTDSSGKLDQVKLRQLSKEDYEKLIEAGRYFR